MSNLNYFGAHDDYIAQTKEYGRTDALFSLLLYSIGVILFILLGLSYVKLNFTANAVFFSTGIVSCLLIGLVFLFCFIRKQKLDTIGFSKSHALQSLLAGIGLLIVVVIVNLLKVRLSGISLTFNTSMLFLNIIYYFVFIAFMEELVIRGYIGTRLFGYFKNKLFSIIIVGIFWSLYHIPFHMIIQKLDFITYVWNNGSELIGIFIMHIIFQWLYSKYNSILAPLLHHFIWDFIQWFIIIS